MDIRKNILSDKLMDYLCVLAILVSLFQAVMCVADADAAEGQRIAPGPVTVILTSEPSQKAIADALVWLGKRCVGSSFDGTASFDGVPAGTYVLRVQHLDYDEHLQEIVLSAGKRQAIEIELHPTQRKRLAGRVTLENGTAVPGARIVVKPLSVPASISGSYDFSTDWQGNYELLEIPAGNYVVELSAFGCAPTRFELHTSAWPDVFTLSARTGPGRLLVQVRDAESGQSLSGARVEISESWPLGTIGERTTDTQGVVQFLGLQIGQLNWMNGTRQLSVTRPWVTVRVEADGYAPQLQIVNLLARGDMGSALEVLLHASEPVQEEESNDSIVQAQNIVPGRPVVLSIDRNGDVDTFTFRLQYPARLQITAQSPPIETYLTLFDVNGERLTARGGRVGKDNVIDQGFPAGIYFLEVREWGDNASSQQPFPVSIVATTSPDPFEPNDRKDQARLIKPGNELRGSILPQGDLDLYHFQLDRPGTVRFSVDAHVLETYLQVQSDTGQVLKSVGIPKNRPGVLEVGLDAGRYIFMVREWGDNAESAEPYSIRFHLVADDDYLDPDRESQWLAAVREQALTGISGATINRLGDYDRYRLVTDQSGLLRLHLLSPIETFVRVRDQAGKVLAQGGQGGGTPLNLTWSASGPMTVFLEIEEWGNNNWSASPYLLQTWWEPADDYERRERNDDSQNATIAAVNEVIRGSITPVADVDYYHFPLDHPGYFEINGKAPTELFISIYGGSLDSTPLVRRGFAANSPIKVGADVSAGDVYLRVEEWGNNHSCVGAYGLNIRLDRAEANEPETEIANETLRPLRLGEAQSFAIDQFNDRDRFLLSVDQAGEYLVHSLAPIETYWTIFDDRSGILVGRYGVAANRPSRHKIVAGGPTRYRIEVSEWGNNNRSILPGHLLVQRADVQGGLIVENIVWSNESTDPTLIHFSRSPEQQAARADHVWLDADGDGQWDIDIPPSAFVTYRLPEEGIYAATVLLEGAAPTRSRFWLNAVGPRERKGIWISAYQPVDGQIVASDIAVKVRAISYSGARIDRVTLAVDGKHMDTVYKSPFDLQVPWAALRGGRHEIAISALDSVGNKATLKRMVERSPYFDLQPMDGAAVTGEKVIVRWTGYDFGPAQVRYRRQGTEPWQVVIGEQATQRTVVLEGLEAGVIYEFQPLGDGEWGPLRRFSRVKGLAFGRSRYGANIARDYDQRLAISVRNHAEHPMSVRLRSLAPQDSRLLVGFVGEGSENVPFTLDSGEEREFMLGISAQDVIKSVHSFPVWVESAEGFRDEALVEVKVKLPEVALRWEALGPAQDGMSQRFRLRNVGDTLTDLQIQSDQSDAVVTPAVDHTTLPRGATLDVTVAPDLYEGFQQLQGKLIAKALDKTISQDFKIALNEGESVYRVTLSPGDSIEDTETRLLEDAHHMVGANLDAATVDWSSRQYPEDSDGDGKVDRWFMPLPQYNTLWVGDDTDGDGQVDFAHADVGEDGKFDYSAYKVEDRWQQTNIVETWLELNFRLPWVRSRYEKHDVEIVLNDQVVGTLSDQIPEGNYRFRLPPSVVNLGDKENQVAIRSKHLRGGHYVVSSDFRIMLRLLGAQLWGIGTSREEAGRRLRQTQEIMDDAPDYSVSSRELRIEGELQAGNEVAVTIPLRNIGARRTWYVPVALVQSQPGKKDVTVAEILVEGVFLIDSAPLSIPWTVQAGSYQLKVVVDPDNLTSDQRRENNVAMVSVDIAGDTTMPTVEIQQPEEGRDYGTSLVLLEAIASDDVGVSALEVQIDGGLWVPLPAVADQAGAYRGKALLQPGTHRLTFRSTDFSGNVCLQSVTVGNNAPQPRIDIVQPRAGSEIDARQATVIAGVGKDVIFAAGRVNNGSWTRLAVKDGQLQGVVPLTYGLNNMELMVVNTNGTMNQLTVPVTATRQPTSDEAPLGSSAEDGRVEIEGLGVVDLFGPLNRVISVAEEDSSGATSSDLKSWRNIAQLLELFHHVNTAMASGGVLEKKQSFPVLPSCSGATVVLQKNKSDWYCTNRPKINVGFRLPQGVMDLDIPDPEKNPEQYEKMIRALMERLARNGVDTKPFQRYFDALLNQVSGLDHVSQMPQGVSGFFQWLGISANLLSPPGQDPESLALWRKQLANKTKIFWARLLSTEDTVLIAEGLKRRMQATRKFDEGVALEAQAVIDAIGAHQQLTQDVLEIVPLVGEGIDLYAAFTGTAPLTGQQLSAFERSVRAIAFLGPIAFDSAMARYAGAEDVTDVLLGKSDDMARSMQDFAARLKDADFRKAVAKATKGRIPEEELLKASESILASKRLRELVEAAGNSPRGRAWETFIAKRGGGVDLNDLNRNFPIIDWINPKGEYVSIYNSLLKGDKLANDLVGKYMDLFGFGADPKKMYALLKKHGHAISEIDFYKKARFHVPTKEHADLFRRTLLDRFNEFGLDDMLLESADLLRKAWPGASDRQLVEKMMDMVMYTDNLPKVVQPVGALRRAIMRSPAVIGRQLSGCDAQ